MDSNSNWSAFRLTRREWYFWGAFALITGLLFQHGDVRNAAVSCLALLQGHIKDFYEYNNNVLVHDTLHFPPKYLVFAAWTWPFYMLGWITDIPAVERWMLYYKLWLTLLLGVASWLMYQIGNELPHLKTEGASGVDVVTAWLTHPLTFFSQVIWGGYDVIYVCFLLGGMLLLLRNRLVWATVLMGIAAAFKNIALLVFVPLLLLQVKNPARLFALLALFMVPQLVIKWFYRDSPVFINSVLTWDHITRIFSAAIFLDSKGPESGKLTSIGWFFLAFFISSWVAYLLSSKSKSASPWQAYLPMVILSAFFSFVFWHPHWMVIFTPFLVLASVSNPNRPFLHLIDLAMGFFFLALAICLWMSSPGIVLHWGLMRHNPGIFWPQHDAQKYFRIPMAVTELQRNTVYHTALVALWVSYVVLLFPPLQKILPRWEGNDWDRFNFWVFRLRLYAPVGFFAVLMLWCYL